MKHPIKYLWEKPNPQAKIEDKIINKAVKDAMNQLDYVGVERQRMEDLLYFLFKQGFDLGIKEAQEEIIARARIFNGQINTIDDLFSHLLRLQKCSDCGREFYDKRCPACLQKHIDFQVEEGKKLMIDEELSFLEQLKEVRGYSKTYLAKKIDIRIQKLNQLKEQK